jgi:hypothetical protein
MKPYPKYFEKIRIRRDKDADAKPEAPLCQWDGCREPGTHRAPVGRMREGEYFRFCFDHVREYNKGFNYFSGVSDSEVARFQKEAMTGHRPTWKMGVNSSARSAPDFASAQGAAAGNQGAGDFGTDAAGDRHGHQDPLQGTGQTPSPRREWRRPGIGRQVQGRFAGLPGAQAGRPVLISDRARALFQLSSGWKRL